MENGKDKPIGIRSADCASLAEGHAIGAYRIVRRLGGGGMGTVYEAVHNALGTRIALKIFTLDKGDVDFLRNRFLTEGRLLARLRHPRLVRVYDLAVDDATGSPYFTMDLVLGPSGQPVTLEQVRKTGKVREEDAARWYADICEALEAVHAAGVVHRDVKLENVLVDAEGHAVLSDFGVSRILAEGLGKELNVAATTSLKTPEGMRVLGTNGYLAPEVRNGSSATAAADLYALGFMLFRLLTGVWYEPDTNVLDLLAPFDPQWRKIICALLDTEPTRRRAIPFSADAGKKKRHAWRWLMWVCVPMLALGATTVSMVGRVTINAPLSLPLSKDVSLEFVACPAGAFQMGLKGDHATDSIRREHRVNITRPFWFGKYPITVAQWESATGETVEMTPEMEAIGKAKQPMNAMKGQLMACCSNLTARFADRLPYGYVFRPPTEAEWEYACRGCGTDPDDVYNRFFRDDFWEWRDEPAGTNLYIWTDESLAALLRERGVAEIPSFTSWSGTRVFPPIGEHQPNSCGIYDLNIGDTGAIALDSIDSGKRAVSDPNTPGYGKGQTALVYADEETDPVRCGSTNAEAFIQLVFARGTHKLPMMSGAGCRNTLRLVIGPDLLNPKPPQGFRMWLR